MCGCLKDDFPLGSPNAKKLMLGHYSQRYDSDEPLLKEAKQVFKNTILANEGLVVDVVL